MKLKSMLSAVLIASLPVVAQAGQAPELTMQLNEPLSTASPAANHHHPVQVPLNKAHPNNVAFGSSAAVTKARLNLNAHQQHETHIEVNGDPLALARAATH